MPSVLTEQDVLKIIDDAEDFPTLSTAAVQISQMTQDLQVPVGKVAKLISMDVALSTKLLRVVNSSFYGLSSQVSDVTQAINILGYKKVGSIALGLAVMDTYSVSLARGFDLKLFWERSVCNAVASGLIASKLQRDIPGEVFTAGLLQDIGCLFLAQCFPIEYGGAIGVAKVRDAHLARVEREVIGLDHAAVGGLLVRHWCLPSIFEETIREHHFVAFENDISASPVAELIRVVNTSSLVTDVFYEEDREKGVSLLRERAQEHFGLDEQSIEDILEKVPGEMQEAGATFDLKIRLKAPPKKDDGESLDSETLLQECPKCGSKGTGKFCIECGTRLTRGQKKDSNKCILIAEDSVATRRALAFILQRMGYEVMEAVNGAEALDLAKKKTPDLVMLDILMPVLGGIEALKGLRQRDATASIPIIMLTSLTDSTTVVDAIEAGANDYIVKPYSSDTIIDRVKKYLEEPAFSE